ncbi:F-box/kelch-repeat protein At3g06240-like [Salvia miltiorrhiza]|uniref:F-box/kelch-repeat protein At3g06240-like n=1 Tax=Salvia miltiorrhiza TaxID=226208 RepID=UPI0025AB9710|nr:F-box/kelch-repeat protein At3g06240-like [Salvia miltiorrhiza]
MDSKSRKLSLPFLPEEIIEEILPRLAVKSLLRFRCVSKSWHSLIGSEQFIKTHLQNSSKNTALAHHRLITSRYSKQRQHRMGQIVGCCNGLVCVIWKNCFVLWNPAIRIFKESPPSYRVGLVNCGFGWDESSGEYKLLVVSFNDSLNTQDDYMCEVYGSKSNSWKPVESGNFDSVHGKAHFASGKLHWLRMKANGGLMNIVADIVTFDLKSEAFGKMEFPRPCDSSVRLGALEGRLCVVSNYKRTHFDVWFMKDDSWVKMMQVLVYEPCQRFSVVKRVSRGLDAEILLLRALVFSVHHRNLVEEDVFSLFKKLEGAFEENVYIESLVSPV